MQVATRSQLRAPAPNSVPATDAPRAYVNIFRLTAAWECVEVKQTML